MSREFGSSHTGFFHNQMEYAARDCLAGRDDLTKLWGRFLEEFKTVAYAIASSEAYDSGPEDAVMETIRALPQLKQRLEAIVAYCEPFKRVAEIAVGEAMEKQIREARGK